MNKSHRSLHLYSPGPLVLIVFLISCLIPMGSLWPAVPRSKPYKKESNISTGVILGHSMGFIKSFGWYFVPGIVKFDLSAAIYVGDSRESSRDAPFSGNLSFHLPIHGLTPFISGGAGYSLRGAFHKNLGGGIKIRIARHKALLLEYRYIVYRSKHMMQPESSTVYYYNYVGAGISYFY